MSGESYEIKNKRRRKLLKNRTPVEEENVPDDTVQLIINSEEGSVDNYEVESSSNVNILILFICLYIYLFIIIIIIVVVVIIIIIIIIIIISVKNTRIYAPLVSY